MDVDAIRRTGYNDLWVISPIFIFIGKFTDIQTDIWISHFR